LFLPNLKRVDSEKKMSETEEELKLIIEKLQKANDNAVYDEILLLQRFLGQPQANLSSIRRDYQTGIQTIEEIEKISASIDKLNDEIQNEISKNAEIIEKELLNEVIEINDDL